MYIALVVLAYFSGSLASAVIVCRALRLGDPRAAGSGNPGTTNVLRLFGKKAAALTLIGDLLKGLLPVLLLRLIQAPDVYIVLAGLGAFLGHIYPIFFGFCGGKGVATFIGVLLGFHWLLGVAFISTWLLTAWVWRYASLSAITASALTPLYCWLVNPAPLHIIAAALMAMMLICKHQSNIKNLLTGSEDKIGGPGP